MMKNGVFAGFFHLTFNKCEEKQLLGPTGKIFIQI